MTKKESSILVNILSKVILQDFYHLILLMVMALVAVYIVIDGIIVIMGEKNSRKEEQFDTLLKSEKAAYLLQKKHFEEIEEQLIILEDKYKIPSEEIINAQKGVAKVIISRSKENADAIISSNDQVMERLDEIEEAHKQTITALLEEQKNSNAESKNKMDAKIQDVILHMKDMELRLNQTITQNSKVIISAKPEVMESAIEETALEFENVEDLFNTEEPVFEDSFDALDELPMEDSINIEDTFLEEDFSAIEELVEETIEETIKEEPIKEELPPMPDLSDPNKVMTPDEIAALIANL